MKCQDPSPPFLWPVCAGTERLRHYVAVHALPVILTAEPLVLGRLLQQAMSAPAHGTPQAQAPAAQPGVAAFVCLLRAARSLQLINSLDALLKEGVLPGVEVEQVREGEGDHCAAVVPPAEQFHSQYSIQKLPGCALVRKCDVSLSHLA
jgi:hypothetical protein